MIELNVLGTSLDTCCKNPVTGFFRDGFCRASVFDQAKHIVCGIMTNKFLLFTQSRGNDLRKPNCLYNFPGLKQGDKWCICAYRWKEAWKSGVAPPICLEATNRSVLNIIEKDILLKYNI